MELRKLHGVLRLPGSGLLPLQLLRAVEDEFLTNIAQRMGHRLARLAGEKEDDDFLQRSHVRRYIHRYQTKPLLRGSLYDDCPVQAKPSCHA